MSEALEDTITVAAVWDGFPDGQNSEQERRVFTDPAQAFSWGRNQAGPGKFVRIRAMFNEEKEDGGLVGRVWESWDGGDFDEDEYVFSKPYPQSPYVPRVPYLGDFSQMRKMAARIPFVKTAADEWYPVSVEHEPKPVDPSRSWYADAKFVQAFPTLDAAKAQVQAWAEQKGELGPNDVLVWWPQKPETWGSAKGQIRGPGGAQVKGTSVWYIGQPGRSRKNWMLGIFDTMRHHANIDDQTWDSEVVPELCRLFGENRALVAGASDTDIVQNIIEELRVSGKSWAGEVVRNLTDWQNGTEREIVKKESGKIPLLKRAWRAKFEDQIYGANDDEWRVGDIADWMDRNQVPVTELKISDLENNLQPSPEDAKKPENFPGSPEFREIAEEADLKWPIFAATYPDGTWIIDGVHRLWKAKQAGQETIQARLISKEQLEQIPKLPAKKTKTAATNSVNIHELVPPSHLGEEQPAYVSGSGLGPQYFDDHVLALEWAKDFAAKNEDAELDVHAYWRKVPDLKELALKAAGPPGVLRTSTTRASIFGGTWAEAEWFVGSATSQPIPTRIEYGTWRWTFYRDGQQDPNGPTGGMELDSKDRYPEYRRLYGQNESVVVADSPVEKIASHSSNIVDELQMAKDMLPEKKQERFEEAVAGGLFTLSAQISEIAQHYQHPAWRVNAWGPGSGAKGKSFLVNLPLKPTRSDLIQKILSLPIIAQAAGLKDGSEMNLSDLIVSQSLDGFRVRNGHGPYFQFWFAPIGKNLEWFDARSIADHAGIPPKITAQIQAAVQSGIQAKDWYGLWDLADALFDLAAEWRGTSPPKPNRYNFEDYQTARDIGPLDAIEVGKKIEVEASSVPLRKAAYEPGFDWRGTEHNEEATTEVLLVKSAVGYMQMLTNRDSQEPQPYCEIKVWENFKAGEAYYSKMVEIDGEKLTFESDPAQAFARVKQFVGPGYKVEVWVMFWEEMEDGKKFQRLWTNTDGDGWRERRFDVPFAGTSPYPMLPYLGSFV